MAGGDAELAAWRTSVSDLGALLVDLDARDVVTLARGGQLMGESAAAWAEADAGVATAWLTFQEVGALLDQAGNRPRDLAATLAKATVTAPGGPTDPTSAMRAATEVVRAAAAVADRLAHAWEDLGRRVDAARASATSSGDVAMGRAADALRELLNRDPLAVDEKDLAGIEAAADESARRRSAATTAIARLDLDLHDARRTLDQLDADLQGAAGTISHAMSRIAGLAQSAPVPDLDALAAWLGRIEQTASGEPAHAASALDDWINAAAARRAELDAALSPIVTAMERRERGRGLWTALRAKAAGRRLDEDPQVAAALQTARDLLWEAPCDLDAAEAALAALTAQLDVPASPRRDAG